MKIKYIFAMLILGLVSCSEEPVYKNGDDNGKDKQAQFIASISKTYGWTNGNIWDVADAVGVSGGDYNNIKYVTSTKGADRYITAANEDRQIVFTKSSAINFTVYYPFTAEEGAPAGIIKRLITEADQKAVAQRGIDFMYGTGRGSKISSNIELSLQHKMSLLTLVIKSALGDISDLESFTIKGLKLSGEFNPQTGEVSVGSPVSDFTFTTQGEELSGSTYTKPLIMYPQSFTAPLPIEINWKGATIKGELALDNNQLVGNAAQVFEIAVSKDGLAINSVTAQWIKDEQESEAQKNTSFKAELLGLPTGAGITDAAVTVNGGTPTMIGGKYALELGDKLEVSFKLQSGKRIKPVANAEGGKKGVYHKSFSKNGDVITCSYTGFISDITIPALNFEIEDYTDQGLPAPAIGDFYYSDGTWSSAIDTEKSCIGVVVRTGEGEGENSYMVANSIKGYVLAIYKVEDTRAPFGSGLDSPYCQSVSRDYTGLNTTDQIRNLPDFSEAVYTPFYRAVNYAVQAPVNTSGWYLPGLGEWIDIFNLYKQDKNAFDAIDKAIRALKGTDFKYSYGFYWTAAKKNTNDSRLSTFDIGGYNWKPLESCIRNDSGGNDNAQNGYARSMLIFY